jgi:hypothetical protein
VTKNCFLAGKKDLADEAFPTSLQYAKSQTKNIKAMAM